MAYADEIAAANRLKDRDARFEARNAVRAKYGMEPEKRKRGGIAGAYDRNKALVQAAAPVLAGLLVPGAGAGIAGAVTGGLARGLDRPGQGGIGLDLGQAARGAVSGYGLGKLGGMAGAKLGVGQTAAAAPAPTAGNMPGPAPGETMRTVGYGKEIGTPGAGTGVVTSRAITPAAPPASTPPSPSLIEQSMRPRPAVPGAGTTTMAPRAAEAIIPPTTAAMPAPTPVTAGMPLETVANANTVATPRQPGVLSRLLAGARENAPIIQATATPLAAVIGGRMEQDIEERKLRLQEEQFQREQEARDRLAQLLMPMFQQQAGRVRPMTTPRG